jgi:hypothetical protein
MHATAQHPRAMFSCFLEEHPYATLLGASQRFRVAYQFNGSMCEYVVNPASLDYMLGWDHDWKSVADELPRAACGFGIALIKAIALKNEIDDENCPQLPPPAFVGKPGMFRQLAKRSFCKAAPDLVDELPPPTWVQPAFHRLSTHRFSVVNIGIVENKI